VSCAAVTLDSFSLLIAAAADCFDRSTSAHADGTASEIPWAVPPTRL
jgi:hypothetical protein